MRLTLRERVQQWLGIYALHDSIANMREHFLAETVRRDRQIGPLLDGVGRIIAKGDAMFARSENPLDDPERKAESDAIGKRVIERLQAEDKARRHTLGEL